MNREASILREAALRASERLYRRRPLREAAEGGFMAGAPGRPADGAFLADVAHRSARLQRLQRAWEKGHAAGLSWTAQALLRAYQASEARP